MSELHRDPSSGDWVIIAPGRAARPVFLDRKRVPRVPAPKATCPFEHPEKTGNWPPVASYPAGTEKEVVKKWRILAFPNKYPILTHGKVCSIPFRRGLYEGRTGIGSHEIVITREHMKNFGALDAATAKALFGMFQDRCRAAADDPCLVYVVPFFNWGPNAGASVWHPHYQVLALPVVPGHSGQSLAGTRAYFAKHHRCVRCEAVRAEQKEKIRVVAENRNAIAITPFASKVPFEVRILPKRHYPYFYKTPAAVTGDVALLLQRVMRDLKQRVNDPDLNFFIHEAPVDGKAHEYHHWHVEVLPRLTIPAGFEFSTGIFVDIVDPAEAAAILRGKAKARPHYD